ncbi:hypothetical protein ACH5RR_029386 [Cinchona calisaya]|uniref:Uncharacterized protein n=1 Tax=Cinchona calisaya TaxID=153742 RepID=A0ABD2YV23_9GENT
MTSKHTQVSSKIVGKSSSTAKSDDASSIGPWTSNKFMLVATMAGSSGDDRTRTRTVITLGSLYAFDANSSTGPLQSLLQKNKGS